MAATAHLRNADMKALHKAIGTMIEMENDLDPYYAKEMNNLFQKNDCQGIRNHWKVPPQTSREEATPGSCEESNQTISKIIDIP